MVTLTILRGISGSGKSTWAESQHGDPAIVSRDRIRMSLFGSEKFIDEELVTHVEYASIDAALRSGRNVISDNTNIQWRFVRKIAMIGQKHGAHIEIKVFDVPVETAITQNSRRAANGGRDVPESVIRKQYGRLIQNRSWGIKQLNLPEPLREYTGTPGKPKAFLVDLDGTLAHMRDYRGPYDWDKVGRDDLDETIAEVVGILGSSSFALDLGHLNIIIMSGRDESCRELTEGWLEEHGLVHDELFMRRKGDMRRDDIVKAELFDAHVRDNYDVRFVLDDRNQVVDMWRRMGLTCLQVAEGDF